MKLSTLQEQTAPLVVETMGETINCVWYPGRYTPDLERKAREGVSSVVENAQAVLDASDENSTDVPSSPSGPTAGDTLAGMLLPCIKSWDIQDDNGDDLPVNSTIMGQVPFGVQFAILRTMSEALNVPKPKPTRSGAFGQGKVR